MVKNNIVYLQSHSKPHYVLNAKNTYLDVILLNNVEKYFLMINNKYTFETYIKLKKY